MRHELTRRELLRMGSFAAAAALVGVPKGVWRRTSVAEAVGTPSICFVQNNHVFSMTWNGGTVQQLTSGSQLEMEHCALSPDGRYIVAVAHPVSADRSALFLYDTLLPGAWTQLASEFHSVGMGGVDWFPGNTICCAAQRVQNGPGNVYQFDVAGNVLLQITDFAQDWSANPPRPGIAADVSVSQDGTLIAYEWQTFRDPGSGTVVGTPPNARGYIPHSEVWVMNADGSNRRRISDGGSYLGVMPNGEFIGAYDPTISADRTRVVYSINNPNVPPNLPWNTAHDLYISPIDGSASQRITAPGPVSIVPDWYGGLIVYTLLANGMPYVALCTDQAADQPPTPIRPGGFSGKFVNTPV